MFTIVFIYHAPAFEIRESDTVHSIYGNKGIKVIVLVGSFAHLCRPCSNNMHSQNFIVLIKNVVALVGTRKKRLDTEMEALY